jgi:toxin ParE1/3/4
MRRPKGTITLTLSAVEDLEAILDWYTGQQVPDAGKRLVREIMVHIEGLTDFPESGRCVPEFGIANLREIIHPPFRIVYRLDGIKMRVVRIWRSERLLKMP